MLLITGNMMNITEIGAIGEFIGAIAVLITLAYIAVQTRQSVKTTQQQSHSDLLTRRQDLMMCLLEDREFIDVWSKGCSQQQLDGIDAQRFTSFAMILSSHVQDVYIQYKAGLIDEKVWEAERHLLTVHFTQPGFVDWWEHGKQYVTTEFARHIEECDRPSIVLYDPDKQTWGRYEDGLFAQDAP
jgi:hypothetical protein